jgi:NADPH:quinone reductase-like Zn-dependent oxidoreductase
VYFVADDELAGPMSTRTVIDTRRSVVLPESAEVVKIAAAMNPAMSAWVALRRRVPIEAGQSVLVLGATGNAGQMAIQVARRLGAGRVVGAGRDQARLATLPGIGADATVALTGDAAATAAALAGAASEVDLVIDYLWGKPATDTIMALLRARADRSRALNWIQIGSVAGPDIRLPSAALRSANFRLQGTGQGAVPASGYLAELPSLIDEIDNGHIAVTARPAPLSDVETVWEEPEVPGVRTVLVPVARNGHPDGLSK